VEANIQCNLTCTSALTGGCTTKCSQPTGGLFCDGQFIDVSDITDCNFSLDVTATVSGDLKSGCSVAAGSSAPFGIPAGLSVVAGLGLLLARRRRQS
jgi:MYXO-CTERM domain-containing protein